MRPYCIYRAMNWLSYVIHMSSSVSTPPWCRKNSWEMERFQISFTKAILKRFTEKSSPINHATLYKFYRDFFHIYKSNVSQFCLTFISFISCWFQFHIFFLQNTGDRKEGDQIVKAQMHSLLPLSSSELCRYSRLYSARKTTIVGMIAAHTTGRFVRVAFLLRCSVIR